MDTVQISKTFMLDSGPPVLTDVDEKEAIDVSLQGATRQRAHAKINIARLFQRIVNSSVGFNIANVDDGSLGRKDLLMKLATDRRRASANIAEVVARAATFIET